MQEGTPELEETVRVALGSAVEPLLQAYERARGRCMGSRILMSGKVDIGIADLVKGQIEILEQNIQHCR